MNKYNAIKNNRKKQNITTYGFEIKQDKQNELPIEQKEVVQQQKEVVQEQKEVQQEQKEKTLQSLENAPIGEGILEVMPDGYGFLRAENFLRGSGDIYISQSQIKRFNLKTGDAVRGNMRLARENEKYNALLYVKTVNGDSPQKAVNRPSFEDLTPIYPEEKLKLETGRTALSGRLIDLIAPI